MLEAGTHRALLTGLQGRSNPLARSRRLLTLSLGGLLLLACTRRVTSHSNAVTIVEGEVYLTRGAATASGGDFAGVLRLVNGSENSVTIDNVRADCGCTAVDWPRTPAAPGDTLDVPIVLDCRRSGPAQHEVEVWVGGLRAPLRAVVLADCP